MTPTQSVLQSVLFVESLFCGCSAVSTCVRQCICNRYALMQRHGSNVLLYTTGACRGHVEGGTCWGEGGGGVHVRVRQDRDCSRNLLRGGGGGTCTCLSRSRLLPKLTTANPYTCMYCQLLHQAANTMYQVRANACHVTVQPCPPLWTYSTARKALHLSWATDPILVTWPELSCLVVEQGRVEQDYMQTQIADSMVYSVRKIPYRTALLHLWRTQLSVVLSFSLCRVRIKETPMKDVHPHPRWFGWYERLKCTHCSSFQQQPTSTRYCLGMCASSSATSVTIVQSSLQLDMTCH